jgi:Domain of unknown function (DUF397)
VADSRAADSRAADSRAADSRAESRATVAWVRSGRCESSNCVEVALMNDEIAVRNSSRPDGPMVTFSKDEWHAFLGGVLDGEFRLG